MCAVHDLIAPGWLARAYLQGFRAVVTGRTVLFTILGCFLDGISMVVLTASVILPSVRAAGIDLLWFGIHRAGRRDGA